MVPVIFSFGFDDVLVDFGLFNVYNLSRSVLL